MITCVSTSLIDNFDATQCTHEIWTLESLYIASLIIFGHKKLLRLLLANK